MNDGVVREFKSYFRNPQEAKSRAMEYLSTERSNAEDRRDLALVAIGGGIGGALGYTVEYLVELPSDHYLSTAIFIGFGIAAYLRVSNRRANVARSYLQRWFGARS